MEGQVAVVTGGGRGIGKTIGIALAKKGVTVVITDINIDDAIAACKEIEALGVQGMPLQMNVADSASVEGCFNQIREKLGRIDILVNNAGITRDGLLMKMRPEDWSAVIDVNLKGTFLCTKEAVKVMIKNRYGRIINIASVVGFMGNAGQANYSASKAGVIALAKTTAKEYAARGVTANAVAPGFIVTAMTDALSDKVKEEMLKAIPMGKLGSVDDVANAVVFLASPEAGYITGNVIHVNGGMYM
ncbi:MAG: 3-oxoacyl-[acyl-carrier-protein] reductase [Candidatus Magnetoovum sp. WYHC-5]|nr:3-oxoacyl-[acyl-carrier-protein] reductase [Candidatus Magnetoovum sp. WYHC-5]